MEQTKIESGIEQTASIGSGFLISFGVWDWIVAPLIFWGVLQIEDTTLIVGIFTATSFIRGYSWRRFFARGAHKGVHNLLRRVV